MFNAWFSCISPCFGPYEPKQGALSKAGEKSWKQKSGERKISAILEEFSSNLKSGEHVETPAPASGGVQDAKAKAQNPRHGTIAFTSKTNTAGFLRCIHKECAPWFPPTGRMAIMDLFAVFSLAAVNGCAGQGSARCKHNHNPKSDIAIIAGFR